MFCKIKQDFKNVMWLCRPYKKYAKKYVYISLLFFVLILPLSRYLDVIFPQLMVTTITNSKSFLTVIGVVALFQLIFLLIPAFEDYYNAKIRDVNEARTTGLLNKEIYEFSSKIKYQYIDDPEYYKSFTWTIEHYAEKSGEAFQLLLQLASSFTTIITLGLLLVQIQPIIILFVLVGSCIRTYGYMKYNEYYFQRDKAILENDQRMNYVARVFYLKEFHLDLMCTHLKELLLSKYNMYLNRKESTMKDTAKKMVYWAIFSDIAYHIFMFFIIILVAYMIYIGKIAEATSYITIMLSIDQLDNNLYTLFENGQEANQLSLYVNDIQKFYQVSVEDDGKDLQQVNHFPFQIQLQDVTFQYDHSAFALRNINMDIHAGETIAIVGENGAGKSTLLKLLLRLYSPQSGTIFINEKDINEYNINTLRNSIGAVFQDGNIYALSLKENLELYDKSDDSAAIESLKSVDLTNVLEKNHCDLSTELTKEFKEDGIVLSGGEVQKLGLARILGKKFGLLVLDEPSAALDPIAEEHMMRLIQEKIKTTTIIVAHRLSTIRHASQIFVMKSGRIIEHGTHEELMNVGGYYKEMFDTQSKNYKD